MYIHTYNNYFSASIINNQTDIVSSDALSRRLRDP